MNILESLKLILLLIALLINSVLAFTVYKNNPKSATNRVFSFLSVLTLIWLIVIYLSKEQTLIGQSLFLIRQSVFLAVPQVVLFYILAVTIPNKEITLSRRHATVIGLLSFIVMALTLSPFVFSRVEIIGGLASPVAGWALPIFVGFAAFFSVAAIFQLVRKIKKTSGVEAQQIKFMLYGILGMLGLIVVTILIPVALFKFSFFVSFAPFYTLIYLTLAAYAIVKHHLFNLKVIATEALTIGLLAVLLAKVFVADTTAQRTVDVFIFLNAVVFGIFLIRSVRKEVQQREELQVLSDKLAEANEQLKALDKARSDFITIASHQLRTPPATIKWYLGALLSGDYGEVPAGIKEQLMKAQVTNNGLISLIDDMLNASRIERGKMEFLFEETDLVAIAKTGYEQLVPQATMKKIQLVYNEPTQKIPHVMADQEKMRQVINNFIDNAIKYTKEGTVSIHIEADGDWVTIKVTDSGKGLSDEEQKTLFEKYTRGKDAMTHSAGLGLGLYVAKIIIAQHKGKIWAESAGEGKGSTFACSLPLKVDLPQTSSLNLAQADIPQK